jgi:hypothetical protein
MAQADSVHSTPPTNTSAIDDPQSPVNGPTEAQDSLYLPTDVSPEEVFQAIGRLRKEARDEVDRLIGFLDKTDDYMFRELRTRSTTIPTVTRAKQSHPSAGQNRRPAGQNTHGRVSSTPNWTGATKSRALELCLPPIKQDGKSMVVTIAKATAAPTIAKAMNCNTAAKANLRIENLRLAGPKRRQRGAERAPEPWASRSTWRKGLDHGFHKTEHRSTGRR